MRTLLFNLKQRLVSSGSGGHQAGQVRACLQMRSERPGQAGLKNRSTRQASVKPCVSNGEQDPWGQNPEHTGRRDARRQSKHVASLG